jgi:NTE family protein
MDINKVPKVQRALVLQGGVALGAYESGVFKTLCKTLIEEDKKNGGKEGLPLFDIIAGTSSGAINAALLVSQFINNKNWQDAAEALQQFWRHLSTPTPPIAQLYKFSLGESARRYYSVKSFFYGGVQNVFSPPISEFDYRFHDYLPYFDYKLNVNPNTRFHYDNNKLRRSLEHEYKEGKKFIDFPILTRFEKGEPRLLVVSTNVKEGKAATFDSYSDNGIGIHHVMASASFPIYFKYVEIDGEKFCDGGILSNTPLRELIQYHRDFWLDYFEKNRIEEKDQRVPDLEVYVVNVWPTKEEDIQLDHDGVKDRRNDILYSDKTEYDQKAAMFVSDYIHLIKQISDVADEAISSIADPNRKQELQNKIESILDSDAKSKGRSPPRKRKNRDLLRGRFDLIKIVTIERKDDLDNISDKWADFSSDTIKQLIEDGENYKQRLEERTLPEQE